MTDLLYRSIPEMFLKRVAETPDKKALARPAPGDAGPPVWLTWREVADRAKAIAAGLHDLGVRTEDRVAILAGTRLEWVLADLGIMCAGARDHDRLPHHRGRGRGVHRPRLRVEGADRGERRPGRQGRRPRSHRRRRDRRRRAGEGQLTLAELEKRGAGRARRAARPDRGDRRDHQARAPGDADLHLRHHRPAEGRRTAARRLGVAGPGAGRAGMLQPRRPAVPVAAAVALVRQDAAVRHRLRRRCRPTSTAGSTSSSTTSARSGRR